MRKDVPLSELLKNEKIIKQSITKEQAYNKLLELAFNKAYDEIELAVKRGNHSHFLGPFYNFRIDTDYYNAMIEKKCDLYNTGVDSEFGPVYFLIPPQIYEGKLKSGIISSKYVVSCTQPGKRFINDLQNRFRTEGIKLQFVPYINSTNGIVKIQLDVPFPTPPTYGGILSPQYRIEYGVL